MTAAARTPRLPLRREDSFFGLHFDLHAQLTDTELGRLVDEALVRAILKAARPDYLQCDCKGHPGVLGYPDSKVSASSPGIIHDALGIYRKVTAKAKVALFVHFSGVWDNQACNDHPEWAAVDASGKRYPSGITSTFGPYVRARMIFQMREVMQRYQVEGFWVDGDCWAVRPDFCAEALQRFRAQTGQEQPPTEPGTELFRQWMQIHRDQFFEYVRTYMHALHQEFPQVQIASNWMYSLLCPEPVKLPVDFVSGDYSHSDSVNSARLHGRYLASVGLPWDLMAWAFSIVGKHGHVYKPALQLQQEAAAILALGGGFQMYFHPDRHGGLPPEHLHLMREVAEFCHERRELCHQGQTIGQVAVLVDTSSLFTTSAGVYAPWGGEYDALSGTLQAVIEAGHSADVLADHQLPWQQDHFPVIIVPQWEHLPTGVVHELTEYARRGGSLLLIGGKTSGFFAQVLGVKLAGQPQAAAVHLHSSLAGDAPSVGVQGAWQDVTLAKTRGAAKSAAKAVAWRTPGLHPDEGRSVAATVTHVGRGKIAAIYGPLGTAHLHSHAPWIREFLDELLCQLYQPRVRLLDATGAKARGVEVVLREKQGKQIVHLNNVQMLPSNEGGRYLFLDRLPAIEGLQMTIRVPGKPRRVTWQPAGAKVPWQWAKGELTVKVPPVAVHGAVVLEG